VCLGWEIFQTIYIQSDKKKNMGEYGVNTCYMFVEFKAIYDFIDRTGFSRLWSNFMSLENVIV
jgi:hypothetical protein